MFKEKQSLVTYTQTTMLLIYALQQNISYTT